MIEIKTKIPGPKSIALMERRKNAVARGPFHTTPIFASKAQGAWITDVDENKLLDFSSGIGVVNVGHSPKKVVEAATNQLNHFIHTSFNVVAYENYISVCEKLNSAMPGKFTKKSFLANSGAEAVENAIKISRAFTGKQAIICFQHAYHGRTYMAMSLTAKAKPYKYGFAPFNSEVYRCPFPYPYRWPTTSQPDQVAKECFKEFKTLVQSEVGTTQVAAVIIEPVLGEGGFVPAPKKFLSLLREFCTENQIILIFDEVQCGFGRTGTLFACEQLGVTPDLLVSAKGIAAGLPLSAVTGKAEIMDGPSEGGIGGTFCGNPVACAAALAVFEEWEKGTLTRNILSLEKKLVEYTEEWFKNFNIVGDVRGLGPMRAIELVKNRETKEPNPEATKELVKLCYEKGLILMTAGTFGNVIRFLPPLCTTETELEQGLNIIQSCLTTLTKDYQSK
jgi:4-aminobutyrate aminotransferase/(S)-3-amino-2-methylpropionate transaminase